jgi:hypothetical protein
MESNPLYIQLKAEIDVARAEGKDGVQIANSEGMSVDQIHRWFPDMDVGWRRNHIQIRWAN